MIRTRILSAAILVAAARAVSAQSIEQKLDQYMAAREALGQFSGAVLVAKHGKVLLSKGYGYANIERRAKTAADTRFLAASISKQFTAMAVLRLREAGKLSLSDSICRYIERCPSAWNGVTISQLIHHSSGIPDYEEALELGSARYSELMGKPNIEFILDSARTKSLDFAPGTKYHYSNTGYILLGKIIERASGSSYENFVQRTVLDRVGMTHSGLMSSAKTPWLAIGYTAGRDRPLDSIVAGSPLFTQGLVPVPAIDVTGAHGDAALYTTVGDLYKWITALDDPQILAPKLRDEFFTPSLGGDSTMAAGYAFGIIVNKELGTAVRFHTGALPGFISRESSYPDSGVTVIVMANGDFFRVSRIARDLAAAAMGLPFDVPRSHVVVQRDTVNEARLAGDYTMQDGIVAKVSVGERFLELQVPGRFTAGLLPESGNLFYAPFFEGTVRFDRDSDGVAQLVMHYDGLDRPAKLKS